VLAACDTFAEASAASSKVPLLVGLAVAICATTAAAFGFLCWRRWRQHEDDCQRHQPMHKQARRLQDSMILTKKRSLDAQSELIG